MDRRSFFKRAGSVGAGLATSTALAAPALAQERYEWRMVTAWPSNFPGFGTGAHRLKDRIAAASAGRLTIDLQPNDDRTPPAQALDAVIDGSAEMCHGAACFWEDKAPSLNFFCGIPFGMTGRELSAWIHQSGGQEIWDRIYEPYGIQAFLAGDTGVQAGGWFSRQLTGVGDIDGLSIHAPNLSGRVWARMGASVENLAMGAILPSLQSGAIDAATFIGPYIDLAFGFHNVCENYYLPSYTAPSFAVELAVDKAKFQSLPADLQAIVRDCCQAEYDAVAIDFAANDPRALRALSEQHGVKLHRFPDDIVEASAKAATEIVTELRESDDQMMQKTAESYFNALDLLRFKSASMEARFIEARNRFFPT